MELVLRVLLLGEMLILVLYVVVALEKMVKWLKNLIYVPQSFVTEMSLWERGGRLIVVV